MPPVHDYVLDNATGANFRSDLNNALAAIVSNNSSSSEPSTKYAYQWWADTNEGVLKIRNSANDGWVTLLQLDGTLTLEDGSNSAPALGFRDDLNTGIFSSAADTLDITCGGTTRGSFSSSGLTVTGGIDGTGGNIVLGDSGSASDDRMKFGASGDLEIYHDGTNTRIANSTGDLKLQGGGDDILLQPVDTEIALKAVPNGAVELYFDNSKKAETVTGGFTVTGTCTATAFAGDGSALTGISGSGTTINNNANNRVITGSDTSATLEGEANLTYTGDVFEVSDSGNQSRFKAGKSSDGNSDTQVFIGNGTTNCHCDLFLGAHSTESSFIKFGDSGNDDKGIIQYHNNSNFMAFTTNTNERMRILSGGALAIGSTTSSADFLHVAKPSSSTQSVFIDADNSSASNAFGLRIEGSGTQTFGNNNGAIIYKNNDAVGGSNHSMQVGRFLNGSDSVVGVIMINDSSTSYSTSSDYRLKENETSITDGITRLKQLKPYRFNWKTDSSKRVDGFFAHEVSSVVPESIFGEKDAVDSEGNPNYQSIDHSKLVPLLVAAVKELITKVEALEAA